VAVVGSDVEDLLQKRARVRPPTAEYFTVREILAEGSLINDLPPAIRKISGQAILAGVGVQP
jgi:hypothetical protein